MRAEKYQEKPCAECAALFTPKQFHPHQKFCQRSCYMRWWNRQPERREYRQQHYNKNKTAINADNRNRYYRNRKQHDDRQCAYCTAIFTPLRANQKYCTPACCRRKLARTYYWRHREAIREKCKLPGAREKARRYQADKRARDPDYREKQRVIARRWREKHRDERNAQRRKGVRCFVCCECGDEFASPVRKKFCSKNCSNSYHSKKPETIRRAKAYHSSDRAKQRRKQYYIDHRDQIIARTRAWYRQHRNEVNKRCLIKKQQMRDSLADCYIANHFFDARVADIPHEMIELKRKHIELMRTLKSKKKK